MDLNFNLIFILTSKRCQVGGTRVLNPRMKLHQVKSEPQNRRISIFDILFFRVSLMIRLDARGQGGAHMKLHEI